MTIDTHISEFDGLPVVDFDGKDQLIEPADHAFRLALSWEAHDKGIGFLELLAAFLADPAVTEVRSIVIGDWGGSAEGNDSSHVVEALVCARNRLPNLRALFLGELTVDESEISWINQSDVSPLFEAFPNLETLYLRGGTGLRLGRPKHKRLRKLVIETGGMSAALVQDVAMAEFPQLRHLELWLGDDGYGNDVTSDDLRQLLTQDVCGHLVYLGLRDDCRADETAKMLGELGVPPSLERLDLSLGTLSDDGADILVRSDWLKQLKGLDIRHHYVSAAGVARLQAIVPEVNAENPQEPDDWDGIPHRYVAVGE